MQAVDGTPVVAVLLVWAATLSWWDWRHRRIPNVGLLLVLVPALLALVVGSEGLLQASRWSSAAGAAIGLGLTLPGYAMHRLGAGDVKFAVVLGLLLGATRTTEMVLAASLLMGVSALVMLRAGATKDMRFPAALMFAVPFVLEMIAGPWLFGQGG